MKWSIALAVDHVDGSTVFQQDSYTLLVPPTGGIMQGSGQVRIVKVRILLPAGNTALGYELSGILKGFCVILI